MIGDVRLTVEVECPGNCYQAADGGRLHGKYVYDWPDGAHLCCVCRGSGTVSHAVPTTPNLAHIARFLAEHPETVDALELCHSWLNGIDVPWPDDLCEAATRLLELKDAMRGEGGDE